LEQTLISSLFRPGIFLGLPSALETLKKLGVNRLMVEGGGTLNFELMRLGLVDEVTAYVAPMIFGGANAPTMADGFGVPREAALLRVLHLLDPSRPGS
jgi:riboflavin biosynthesis pyrimidine reductase